MLRRARQVEPAMPRRTSPKAHEAKIQEDGRSSRSRRSEIDLSLGGGVYFVRDTTNG
jgi:hypothetical protein